MKAPQATEDIVALGEFTAKASEMLRRLRSTNRPLVITQNGKPAAVMITPKDFDAFVERERFVAAVQRGMADADAGRTIDDGALEAELERESEG